MEAGKGSTVRGGELVWVFHATGEHFPCGVWSSKETAEAWIGAVQAKGVLSGYVLDESAYDSCVRLGRFKPKRAEHSSAEFKGTFSTAVDHHHYD